MTEFRFQRKKILKIMSDVNHNITKIQSEEDAKIQIITRILTETLGWMHSDIACETAMTMDSLTTFFPLMIIPPLLSKPKKKSAFRS